MLDIKEHLVTFCCNVYNQDEIVGRIEIVEGRFVKNEVYPAGQSLFMHPCPKANNIHDLYSWLDDRVIPQNRITEEMAEWCGLDSVYDRNVYKILRKTHAVCTNDFWWLKFDDDPPNLTWNIVNPRKEPTANFWSREVQLGEIEWNGD